MFVEQTQPDLVFAAIVRAAEIVGRLLDADEVSTDTSATVSHRTPLAEPDEEDTDQENASTTGRLTQRSDVEDLRAELTRHGAWDRKDPT